MLRKKNTKTITIKNIELSIKIQTSLRKLILINLLNIFFEELMTQNAV